MDKAKNRAHTIAVIGAGGKTSLCRALMRTLSGKRVFSTTTHIFLPEELPCYVSPDRGALLAALSRHDALCVTGPLLPVSGKATPPEKAAMALIRERAAYVVVEADGAKGRLIKAHGANEPVLPAETELVLFVISHAALGLPLAEAVHRAERIPAVFDKEPSEAVTEGDYLSAALAARKLSGGARFCPVLNCVSDPLSGERIVALWEAAGMPGLMLGRCKENEDPADDIHRALLQLPEGLIPGLPEA